MNIPIVHDKGPGVVAVSLFLAIVAILLYAILTKTQNHFVYALDDPYIHMAMAKNFSVHGVWGITKHEFSSASSSVGWTLVLSLLYGLTGVHDVTPFLVNIGIAIIFIIGFSTLLRRFELSSVSACIVLVMIIVFTPLHVLVFNGMEHLLHACITVLFLLFAARLLTSPTQIASKPIVFFCLLLSFFIILLRFEGAFAVAAVGIVLLVRKRIGLALIIAILSLFPVALYQALAVSKGWYWLPNPILIRAGLSDVASTARLESQHTWLSKLSNAVMQFPNAAIRNIEHSPELLALVAAAAVVYVWIIRKGIAAPAESRWFILLFIIMSLLHVFFGKVGHYFRYEAYLVMAGLTAIGSSVGGAFENDVVAAWKVWKWPRRMVALTSLIAVLYFPTMRAVKSTILLPQAAKNIYEQQYQMAMFVNRYYQGGTIALNDIGAVNYYADIDCFDLVGLANIDVLRRKIDGGYTTEEISKLTQARKTQIAIVYDHWFGRARTGKLPSHWQKIGQWTILDNIVAGGDTVSFYAVDTAHAQTLIHNLQEFSSELPPDVVQTGLYTLVTQDSSP